MTQLNLINLKNFFVYEIGLIAICEVSPLFDEEQQYGRPYQPKHSSSIRYECASTEKISKKDKDKTNSRMNILFDKCVNLDLRNTNV